MAFYIIQIFIILIYIVVELEMPKRFLFITIISAVGALIYAFSDFIEKRCEK